MDADYIRDCKREIATNNKKKDAAGANPIVEAVLRLFNHFLGYHSRQITYRVEQVTENKTISYSNLVGITFKNKSSLSSGTGGDVRINGYPVEIDDTGLTFSCLDTETDRTKYNIQFDSAADYATQLVYVIIKERI